MKIITSKEMSRIDSSSEVSGEILMERAGRGMAEFITDYMPDYPVVVICGKGHNGGDGFVAARHLSEHGRNVKVFTIADRDSYKGLPLKQLKRLNISVEELDINELKYIIRGKKIIVDALLGTGFNPPLRSPLGDILEIINKNSKIILSCDIPTGVSGDTGEADKSAVDADVTVTFEYPKVGHIEGRGSTLTGSLYVIDIGTGLSPKKYRKDIEALSFKETEKYFKSRSKKSHKKDYGHILIIGGSSGLTGAPVMSALGALRSGAGLLTVAVPFSIGPELNLPLSSMKLLLDENREGTVRGTSFKKIEGFISRRKIDAVVVGPGLGVNSDTKEFVQNILNRVDVPVLLDADGLNNLHGNLDLLKERKGDMVITPHPGEMARLTGESVKAVQSDRIGAAKRTAAKTGAVVLLKGYRTVVSDGKNTFLNVTGNPAMAVGGSGDILSGIGGTLLGQGFGPLRSASIAAWVHGRAGDIAAWKNSDRYLNPEEIVRELNNV